MWCVALALLLTPQPFDDALVPNAGIPIRVGWVPLRDAMLLEHACMREDTWLLALADDGPWRSVSRWEAEIDPMPQLEGAWELAEAECAGRDVTYDYYVRECSFGPDSVIQRLDLKHYGLTLWRVCPAWSTENVHRPSRVLIATRISPTEIRLWQTDGPYDDPYESIFQVLSCSGSTWGIRAGRTCFTLRRKSS